MRLTLAFPVVGLLVLGPMLTGCGEGGRQQGSAAPPPTVIVAKPVARAIVDRDEYVGRFVAIDSVEVRSRLAGYLEKVHFTDGQTVEKGDVLFTIDRRPFEVVLDQAKANLAQARANLLHAETDLLRDREQLETPKHVFDQRTHAKNVAEAAVAANEALVQQAELDVYQYSEIRAPIEGRIGDRRVSPGNLIPGGTSGSTTLLATIVSVDPIRFEFAFDEAAYLRYARAEKETTGLSGSIEVALKLIDEQNFMHRGRMDFVDNVIDPSSGVIRARAVFSNPNKLFTPGMAARIAVPGSPAYQALLVPNAAISTEQARNYVLVVDSDNIARQRYVIVGQLFGNYRVIKHGLAADDQVILDGLIFARPGAKVTPQKEVPKQSPVPQANVSPTKMH